MRPKRRTLKKNILTKNLEHFNQTLKNKNFSLSIGAKISLFGCLIVFISLFINWFYSTKNILSMDEVLDANAFSQYALRPGILIFLCLVIIIFSIISLKKKEKFKLITQVQIQDFYIPIVLGSFIFIYAYNITSITKIYQFFSAEINFGKGPIMAMTGAVLIVIGGFFMKSEYSKNNGSYASDLEEKKSEFTTRSKDNMKLPF